MVDFGSSFKNLNGESLERRVIVDTKSVIVNKTYGFLPPYLASSVQLNNTHRSTYTKKWYITSLQTDEDNIKDSCKDSDTKQQNPMIRRQLFSNNLFHHEL